MTGYNIMRALTWVIHKIPLRINYIFSDFIFVLIYYVFRYRKNVVRSNLKNAFPEKSEKERRVIEKKFFHHLCDTFIETLYFDRITREEILKRSPYINPELANQFMDKGQPVVVLLGHYNNWEWLADWTLHSNHRFYCIYKKLKSPTFEKFFYNIRARFGGIPVERSETLRRLVADDQKCIPTFSAFVFDQTPRVNEIQYWTTFLNQDTAVLTGAEKIARKLNAAVLYLHLDKIKRGYYQAKLVLMTDNAKNTAKFEITEQGTRYLEKMIIDKPEYWLWSHRRWKHKKPDVVTSDE